MGSKKAAKTIGIYSLIAKPIAIIIWAIPLIRHLQNGGLLYLATSFFVIILSILLLIKMPRVAELIFSIITFVIYSIIIISGFYYMTTFRILSGFLRVLFNLVPFIFGIIYLVRFGRESKANKLTPAPALETHAAPTYAHQVYEQPQAEVHQAPVENNQAPVEVSKEAPIEVVSNPPQSPKAEVINHNVHQPIKTVVPSSTAKFCTNCGNGLVEGADVCLNCGKLIDGKAKAKLHAPVKVSKGVLVVGFIGKLFTMLSVLLLALSLVFIVTSSSYYDLDSAELLMMYAIVTAIPALILTIIYFILRMIKPDPNKNVFNEIANLASVLLLFVFEIVYIIKILEWIMW